MKKMMNEYIAEIEKKVKDKQNCDEESLEDLKLKISFFQHERYDVGRSDNGYFISNQYLHK